MKNGVKIIAGIFACIGLVGYSIGARQLYFPSIEDRGSQSGKCNKAFEEFIKEKEKGGYYEYEFFHLEDNYNSLIKIYDYNASDEYEKSCIRGKVYDFSKKQTIDILEKKLKEGRYEEAIELIPNIIKKFKEKYPEGNIIDLLYNEAISYERLGKLDTALEKFNLIIDMNLDEVMQNKVMFKIENIKTQIKQKELEEKQKQIEAKLEAEKLEAERIKDTIRKSSMQEWEIARDSIGVKAQGVELLAKILKKKGLVESRLPLIKNIFLNSPKEEFHSIGVYLVYLLEK